MPRRTVPFATGQYYHIYNRGSHKQPIFEDARDYKRFLITSRYYSFAKAPFRFSWYLLLAQQERVRLMDQLTRASKQRMTMIAFCLMPNHYHFLLRQEREGGISRFMSNLQNSYTRYFNTRYAEIGPLFQGQFKTVLVEDDTQLLHLSRYIHLNPYTSYIVKTFEELESFPWSSFQEYGKPSAIPLCEKEIIVEQFKSPVEYQTFVSNHAQYQRDLGKIKHLLLE